MNQGRTKELPKNFQIQKVLFVKIAISYTLPYFTDRTPRDDREKSNRLFAQIFIQIFWIIQKKVVSLRSINLKY